MKTLYKFMGPGKELKIHHERANGAVEMKELLESQNHKIIKAEKDIKDDQAQLLLLIMPQLHYKAKKSWSQT